MASRYRSLPEDEVQDYLAQAQNHRVNPASQPNQADAAQQQAEKQAEKARQEAEKAAAAAAKTATDQAKQQEANATKEQARNVRSWKQAGAEMTVDVETGKPTVAQHADGTVKSIPGPIGAPQQVDTVSDNPASIMMGQADSGATGATGGTSMAVTKQLVRGDRFNQGWVDPDSKTDKDSGVQYVENTDPSTGMKVKQAVGVDLKAKEEADRAADLKLRGQEIDLREKQLKQEKLRFQPQWRGNNDGVKPTFDKAAKEFNDFTAPDKIKFIRDPDTGKMAKRNPDTGLPSKEYVDPQEITYWQKQKNDLETRYNEAKTKHDKMLPYAENLNKAEREAAWLKLELEADETYAKSGIPRSTHISELFSSSTDGKVAYEDHAKAVWKDLGVNEPTPEQVTQVVEQTRQTQQAKQEEEDKANGVNPFTRKLADMDIEAAKTQRNLSTGDLDPVEANRRIALLAEYKGQTIEQAKAEAKASLEEQGRSIAAGIIGTDINAQELSGNTPSGYQKTKGSINEISDTQSGAAEALKASGGDIDKAIAYAEKQAAKHNVPVMWNPEAGDMQADFVGQGGKYTGASKALTKMKAEMDKAGIDPKDRPALIQDAAKMTAWTENDTDNIRKLSTGDIVINPGRAFGQKDALIAEINASDATPQSKQAALKRLESMRKAMVEDIDATLYYSDSDASKTSRVTKDVLTLGLNELRDGYRAFVEKKEAQGVTDKLAILDEFIASQKDRNPLFKIGTAIETGLQTGSIGVGKTVVGGTAGIAALIQFKTHAGKIGKVQQFLGEAGNDLSEAAKLRGNTGVFGITTDLTNTVTQMAPMLVGGWAAGSLKGASQIVTRGASVYGWAAAQGYESKLSDALDTEAVKLGRSLNEKEIAGVLGRKETQIAGFLNGAQTAILAAAFPKGAEAGALGKVSASMTVRDFMRRGGMRAVKDGTLRQEIKAIGKNIFLDAKDEALEEFSNQVLDGMISVAALGKDLKLGTLLEESFKAGALGAVVGGGMPQVYKGKTKQDQHAELTDALVKQSLGVPDANMVSTALRTIDPQAKAPDATETQQARQLVQPSITAIKEIEERRAAYDVAIKAKDYKTAAAIDQEINDKFTAAQSEVAQGTAKAVMLHRELSGIEAAAKERVKASYAQVEQARMTGDKKLVAQAEAAHAIVAKEAQSAPLARAAVKIATGKSVSSLTDSEMRAVGITLAPGGKIVLMTGKELANEGLTKPLVKLGADNSPVLLDETIEQATQASGLVVEYITMGEQAAMEAAQARFDAAEAAKQSPATTGVPTDSLPEGQGAAPGGTAPPLSTATPAPPRPESPPASAMPNDYVAYVEASSAWDAAYGKTHHLDGTPLSTNTPTNEQDPQGQPGAQAPSQAAQSTPADPLAPSGTLPDGSGPTGNAGGTGATPQTPTVATGEAAIYEAARAENPSLAPIADVVSQAFEAGQPVSVSMAKAAGRPVPPNYTKQGNVWGPPAQPAAATGQSAPKVAAKPSNPALAQAAALADQVKASVEKRMPSLKGRVVIVEETLNGGGAEMIIESGVIRLSMTDIQRAITRAGGDVAKATASIENIVARHEAVHVVQTQALRPMWEAAGSPGTFEAFFLDYYGKLAPQLLTPAAIKAAQDIYGKEAWARMATKPNGQALQAAEYTRMLVEAKLNPDKTNDFSELYRAISNKGVKSAIAKLIKAAVEMLQKMKLTGEAAEHVAKLQELYKELTGEESASNPNNSAPKGSDSDLRIETKGDKARVLKGDEVLWDGPADKAQAELESLEAAQSSPMFVTGAAIKSALVKFPRLSGKLRNELEDAADEITDELEALPADERAQAAETAIADRINMIADREAERTGKNRMEVIEGFRAVAGKRASQQAASIEQAVIGSEAPEIPKGKKEKRDTPNSEMTVDVTSTFVDLDQLVGSSDPLFPGGALQPRNRSTQASQNQREEMVQNIRDKDDQHRRYIEGATTDSGRMIVAPLFGADGKQMTYENGDPMFYVISGNGRRNALREAANRGVSGKLMKSFRDTAATEGIDVSGMKRPVPVAIFAPKSAKEAIDLAEFSNRDAQLSVSNTEQANRDASSIEKDNLLKLWSPDATGDAGAASNRDFVKAFARAVGDEGIIDNRGNLTDEGAKRIERAMVAMLLGPKQSTLLDMLFNRSGDLGLRAILGGVASESGSLLKLAGAKPDFDLSPVLADALRTAVEAKQALANGEIRDVSEFFDQGNLFETSAMTPERQLARAIVESRSRKAIREILTAYRQGAEAVDTGTMSMFAESDTSREDLILKALEARPVEQLIAEVEAEFGKDADLSAKLRIAVPAIKKLDAGQRREFSAAIAAEVERLRDGVISAEEWQRINPDALGAREALFQRFLDSHDANTIAGGFNRLLSKPVQAVLGSSSERSAPKEHLGILRKNMPQIPINRRGRFARWMVSQGVGITVRETAANEVGPTQSDLSEEAMKGARKHTRTRNVLVSSDGYILDGHHQWQAAKESGKKFTAVWFDMPVREALTMMKRFENEDYDNMVGTDYENEEYQYLGEASESWRNSPDAEAAIVNPINENLSPDEKVDALLALAMDNVSLVERILGDLGQSMKLEGKYSLKLPERIQAKASRPSIRTEKPWHDIEHVRDGLRFKVSMQNFNQLPAIAETLRRNGVEIVKFDTAKMFKPKAWGWRFVAFDLRMPNGQLVEFYAPVPELDAKNIKGPNHKLFEKWRNVSSEEIEADPMKKAEWLSDILESKNRYDSAFMAGIKRMGYASLEEAEASWNHFVAVASSTSENFSMSSTAVGTRPDFAQAPSLERKNEGDPGLVTKASPLSASPASREGFEVEDGLDTDGAITTIDTKSRRANQDISGSSLQSSASPEFDLFGSIEEQITGPRAKVKRNALAAIKAQAPGSPAVTNIAKTIAKREGLADLDLFAAASVKSLAKKPKRGDSNSDDSDLFSGTRSAGNRQPDGNPTAQPGDTGTVRGMARNPDLFDLGGGNAGTGLGGSERSSGSRGGRGVSGDTTAGDSERGATGESDGSSVRLRGRRDGDGAGSDASVIDLGESSIPDVIPVPANEADRNARIAPGETLVPKGQGAKIAANFKVIELLRSLTAEGRNPTEAEKAQLLTYSGWGHSKGGFDDAKAKAFEQISDNGDQDAYYNRMWRTMPKEQFKRQYNYHSTNAQGKEDASIYELYAWNEKWGDVHRDLREKLSDKEYNAAKRSVLNAHYTTPAIIDAQWQMVEKLGFKGGRALEPGGGIGHYIGTQPKHLSERTIWSAVELDQVTAQILALLYPQARVNSVSPAPGREVTGQGFEEALIADNSQDIVISNVPFHETGPWQAQKQFKTELNLHNYFFARALQKVKPGGFVVFITSSSTMENNAAQRRFLASRGELISAVRLPNNAFKENAGTEVTTDIIILRKPDGRKVESHAWLGTRVVGSDTVNLKRGDQTPIQYLKSFDTEGSWQEETLERARKAWDDLRQAGLKIPDDKESKPAKKTNTEATAAAWKAYVAAFETAESNAIGMKLGATLPIRVNEYFAANPQNAFGKHALAGSMYSPNEYALQPDEEGGTLEERFAKVIEALPADIMGQTSTIKLGTVRDIERTDVPNSFIERDGQFWQVQKNHLEPVEWNAGEKVVFRSWNRVKTSVRNLIAAELDPGAEIEEINELRETLNTEYGKHVGQFGPVSKTGQGQKHGHLAEDPDFPLTVALEEPVKYTNAKGKSATRYEKADIFRVRMNKPLAPPVKAESVSDALLASLVWMGYPHTAYMAKLLGQSEAQVRAEAIESELVFDDPATGNLVIRDSYLSGHVQGKLDEARAAAEEDPAYRRNVAALEAALPERKGIAQIGVAMNSPWLPPAVLTGFMEHLGITEAVVAYNAAANSWSVFGAGNSDQFSTVDASTVELIQHALEMVPPRISNYEGTGRDRKLVFDSGATQLAKSTMDALKLEFVRWAKTSDATVDGVNVQDMIVDSFNEKANGHRPPQHSGEHITLPGASEEVFRSQIRRSAIARMIDQGSGMIAHGVGFGKTYTLIALAMELKRLGKANRPMIIVENATLGQFAASFRTAYPNARLLVADKAAFEGKKRRQFIARIATGDHDCIVMPHSSFNLIGNHKDVVNNYINEQVAELEAARALTDSADKRAVAALEKAKINLENSRKKLLDALASRQDIGMTWEDLGVDTLLVDESHRYKNAPVITRMQGMKNLPTGAPSQRAIGMVLKTRGIQDKMGGRGVFFATGTPVSNSMAEAYIMLRYTDPGLLRQAGIDNFDQFVASFGESETKAEANWKGAVSMETRLSKFVNGNALINLIRSSWDVQMDPDVAGINRPDIRGGASEQVMVTPGPANEAYNDWVINTIAAQWQDPEFWTTNYGSKKQAFEDHPWLGAIPIMTMQAGIAAALDIRLIDPNAPDFENSKVNTAVRSIVETYKATSSYSGAQAVFADLRESFSVDHLLNFAGDPGLSEKGMEIPEIDELAVLDEAGNPLEEQPAKKKKPRKAKEFDLYQDIKQKLVDQKIPASEIALISSAMSPEKRTELFDRVNSGEIRVVIGSTDLMGVGVNMQERLVALHHLMPPRDFKPASMEQRNGRILRQGNIHYDMQVEAFVLSAERSTGQKFRKDKGGRQVPDIKAARAALGDNTEAMKLADDAAANHHIILREYAMEKSIDSAIYSMMAAKQRMVVQLLMGEVSDFFEDPSDAISMGMAEIAARAIGDPTLIRRVELEREIRNLTMEYSGFEADVSSARSSLRYAENAIRDGGKQVEVAKRFAESVGKIGTDTERETVWELGGQAVDRNKPKDAEKGWKAPKLIESLDLYLAEESAKLANSDRKKVDVPLVVDGVKFNIEIHQTLGDTRSEKQKYDDLMAGTDSSKSAVGEVRWTDDTSDLKARLSFSGAQSLIASINAMARGARNAPASAQANVDYNQKNLPSLQFRASRVFEKQSELDKLRGEMAQVERQLAENAAPPRPPAETPTVKARKKGIELPPVSPVDQKFMTPEVRNIIERSTIEDAALTLPEELDRKVYDRVNKALESAGGRWDRSTKTHLFAGDPSVALGLKEAPAAETSPKSETPANYPGKGLAPATLGSSSNESSAVQEALAKMPPIYRKVFEDIEAGDSPSVVMKRHNIPELGVTNILNQVRARIATATAAASGTLKPSMKDGKFDGGRPDLALSTNPTIAAVDQIRNESDIPDVRHWDEVNQKAADLLEKDYVGTYDMLLAKSRDMQPMTDMEVAASKMIIARETLSGKITSAEDRVKLGLMIYGYRDQGTETARSLAIRRDPHLKPAERHAQFIAEALFTPDAETRKRMKNNPKAVETILAGWMKRVDAIEGELLAQGIDIKAALAEFTATQEEQKQTAAESPQAAKVIEEQIRKLNRREKAVIEAIRSGALVSKAAFLTGLSTDEVKAVYTRFLSDIRAAMAESAKRFMAGSLASSPSDMMSEILTDLGLPDISMIDDTQKDFVDRRGEKPKAPRKPRKPKAPEAPKAPEVPGLTPEQQAALDDAWERFLAAPPNKQRIFWQEEAGVMLWTEKQKNDLDAKAQGVARDWSKMKDLLDPREEVSTTTGTFDIHDPIAVKRVMDAFAIARGGKMDAIMEFWKMAILTGPQTHIVNVSSNMLNSAFNLLPRRAAEATVNNLLGLAGQGSDKAATFGEFAPMAKALHKGVQLGARMALRSWQAETRTFEAYARAEALQLDFTGVGAEYIPPALGGKIGKIMRSLSFRAMTAADEFQKSVYAQMEAAAQSHRIAAVEEKLTGDAYAKRIEELMIPGSVAWIRAIDEAKRVTFQDEVDGSNPQMLRRLDQMAEWAKKGRNAPWLGRPLTFFLPFIDTPLNIFKQAIEMSPLGGFIAIADASRALKRRIFAGELTKEEAQAEAALLYDRARLVRDLTNQTLAWAAFFALQGLAGGDDEDELPWITGTVPYKSTRKGERDNAFAVMPPQTIRLGGVQFSYSRVEPFATVLASTVNLLVSMKRNGGFDAKVGSEWLSNFKDQAKEKTFLQGISALIDAVEDPDRFADRLTANIVTGFVPNILRQPIREADGTLRDQNPRAEDGFFTSVAKRVGFSLVPQLAPARMDVWGNEIKTNRGDKVGGMDVTDAAFRIFDPTNAQVNAKADPIDRWIFRYNLQTADSKDRVAIEPVGNSITGKVPGEKRPRVFSLTPQEQAEANRNAGKAARAMLGDDWQKKPLEESTAQMIMDTVRKSQSIERDRLRDKKVIEAMPK